MALGAELQGDPRLELLAERALRFLAGFMEAPVGALYVAQPDGSFRRMAGYALEDAAPLPAAVLPGQGLLGQAAQGMRVLHVSQVPDGYLHVGSPLGRAKPRELLLAPVVVDGGVQCVVELGFFRRVTPVDRELMLRIAASLAMGVRASRDRSRLEELLEETQHQAEELQAQQEELRVSNEELEEQSRVLRQSQARLEGQQAELEQSNQRLGTQARTLENQRDELSNAQRILAERAGELERASQYKSEFLANMSHELRTPLHSTLILAKLLADSRPGNLSPEQVKFAQTISAAGNDLLGLINDILDLSKIEAGKMEVDPQHVGLAGFLERLRRSVEPLAHDRGLAFRLVVDEQVPDGFVTDEARCAQILKNLLSNAVKFTEAGEVVLQVSSDADARMLHFAVRDTGVGIPEGKHEAIFEAFTQADGSTHRRFGGTGLGLTISRDLAQLLGCGIRMNSIVGRGSVFTLTLPWSMPAPAPSAAPGARPPGHGLPPPAALGPPSAPVLPAPPVAAEAVTDDRAALQPGVQTLLVIEDDLPFAAILRDLGREAGFQCVVAHTAADGLQAAREHRPGAILLDMQLPDQPGLAVLDRLKQDPQTRHVPVHVVSVVDHARDAFGMGAVGYDMKPADREQLAGVLARLAGRLSRTLRRLLVVEDDPRQRESIRALLQSDGIEIVDAATAGAALGRLQGEAFDCVVMDLSLPDMSGFDLLERLSERGGIVYPPVIVYTGRSLTRDQEERLRRFSKSIILKGARSPERLLSEVTLFLHQAEGDLPADRQRMLRQARERESVLEGRRVLVVDDDVRNIFALSAVLEPKGCTVAIARNGRESLEVLARSAAQGPPVDLVLMDIMMPEMDGYSAMREIRSRPEFAGLPIIALTAKAMRDDQEKCLAAGASDYIAKPLDVEKLLSLVRVWMRA